MADLNPKDVQDLTKALVNASAEMAKIVAHADNFKSSIGGAKDHLDSISGKQKKQISAQKEIVDKTKEVNDLSIKQGKQYDELNKKQDKTKKFTKDFKDGMKATLGIVGDIAGASGFGKMMNGAADIAGAFMMGGPILGGLALMMAPITFIFNIFLKIDKAASDIGKAMGRSRAESSALGKAAFDLSIQYGQAGVNIEKVVESATALTSIFGNLSYVNKKNLETISVMSAKMGISSEEAAKSLDTFMSMKGSSFEVAKQTAGFAAQLSKAVGLPVGAVMQDLARNSEQAAKFGGKFANSTIIATAAAKKMGLSFADVAKIADGILDIEGSVEKQFEAQTLLGRDVNLEQARYYSLIGDTNKMQKEVLKQVGSQAQFEKMMPIQRQALAAAIGISEEQLGKMVSRQKEGLSVEEKAKKIEEERAAGQAKDITAVAKSLGSMSTFTEQLSASLTNLAFAVMQAFGIDVSSYATKGGEAIGGMATAINKMANDLRAGNGGLSDFIKTMKSWGSSIKWAADHWKTFLFVLVSSYAAFKIIGVLISNMGKGTSALIEGSTKGSDELGKSAASLGTKIADVAKGIGEALASISKSIGESIGALAKGLGTGFAEIGKGIGQGVSAMLMGLATGLVALIPAIPVIAVLTAALWILKPLIVELAAVIGDVFIRALILLAPVIIKIADVMGTVFVKALETIERILPPVVRELKELILGVLDKITLEKTIALGGLGIALGSLAIGMAAMTGVGILTGFASLIKLDPASTINRFMDSLQVMDGDKLKTIQTMSDLLGAFTKVNPSHIAGSMQAISDGFTKIGTAKATLNIQSSYTQNTEQKTYQSESLKYLKIIALSTTMLAEGKKGQVKFSTVDSDLAMIGG